MSHNNVPTVRYFYWLFYSGFILVKDSFILVVDLVLICQKNKTKKQSTIHKTHCKQYHWESN